MKSVIPAATATLSLATISCDRIAETPNELGTAESGVEATGDVEAGLPDAAQREVLSAFRGGETPMLLAEHGNPVAAGERPYSHGGGESLGQGHVDACMADPRVCAFDRYCSTCCNTSCAGLACGQPNDCGATCYLGSGCGTGAIGELESVQGRTITGWACDPDHPDDAATVKVWKNNDANGNSVFLFDVQADEPSDAPINSQCNGGSAHRFTIDVPASEDGETIRVSSLDMDPPNTLRWIKAPGGKRDFIICPAAGCVNDVYPIDDTHVTELNPTLNHGSSDTMYLHEWDGNGKAALFKFDVDVIRGPLSQVKFWFSPKLPSSNGNGFLTQLYLVNNIQIEPWTEDDLTWQSAAPVLCSGCNLDYFGQRFATPGFDAAYVVWFSGANSGINDNGIWTLGMTSDNVNAGTGFVYSKESGEATRPRLSIRWHGESL